MLPLTPRNVHCNIVYNSQDMKVNKMSINTGMEKQDVVHLFGGLLAIKKHKIMPFSEIWMDPETKSERERQKKLYINPYMTEQLRYTPYTYVKSRKMVQMNLLAKQK